MRQHDAGAYIVPKGGFFPISQAAGTVNGPAIDRSGKLSGILIALCGAATGTPTTQAVDAKLQDSADGSTGWADITGAAVTQMTADDSIQRVNVKLDTARQFIRVQLVVAFTGGASPEIPIASVVDLGGADVNPAV